MENKPQPEPQEQLPPFEKRAEAVLAATFHGLHNVPGTIQKRPRFWSINCRTLATFDLDNLTRLVVEAHRQCIRAELSPLNMQYMRLMLHPRQGRAGAMYDRHPNLRQALQNLGVWDEMHEQPVAVPEQ